MFGMKTESSIKQKTLVISTKGRNLKLKKQCKCVKQRILKVKESYLRQNSL